MWAKTLCYVPFAAVVMSCSLLSDSVQFVYIAAFGLFVERVVVVVVVVVLIKKAEVQRDFGG